MTASCRLFTRRSSRRFSALVLPVLLCFFAACTDKKDRITDNTSTIRIDPSFVKVFSNGSAQLKAVAKDAGGNDISISPEWSADPSSLGVFGIPNVGRTAIFVGGSAETTGKIYANYAGLRGEVNVRVFREPNIIIGDATASEDLKKDSLGNVIFSYFDTDNAAPWQIALSNSSSGSPDDPLSSIKVEYTNSSGGWGGFFLQFNSYIDMSIYTRLTFWIKGEAGGEEFLVKIGDGSVVDKELPVSGVTTSWTKKEFLLADFTGLVPITIDKPFVMAFTDADTGASAVVYLDRIAYEK